MTCSCSPQPAEATTALDGAAGSSLSRRAVITGGVALGLTPFLLGRGNAAAAAVDSTDRYDTPDLSTKLVRPIMYPIVPAGRTTVNRLRNYGQNRGSHIHAGEDMMAAKLSLLLAVADATVVRKVYGSGGNYLYLRDADGYLYGYLHINNDTPGTDDGKNPAAWAFAPGIVEGATVRRGQQIAWVGDSGNAESTGSHLHFEIRKPNVKWYWAQAIDPAPSLDAADDLGFVCLAVISLERVVAGRMAIDTASREEHLDGLIKRGTSLFGIVDDNRVFGTYSRRVDTLHFIVTAEQKISASRRHNYGGR